LDAFFDCDEDKLQGLVEFCVENLFGTYVIHAHSGKFFPIEERVQEMFFDGCEKWELGIGERAVEECIRCAIWMDETKKEDEEKYVPFFQALGTHERFIMEVLVLMVKSNGHALDKLET